MKTKFCIGIFLLATAALRAQTNDLTALLQQGLFEEQANRNLDAAIANYQTLALQFDKDRQLAATAVFRLGECYRAQGRTNEAAAQYQRILRDFSDQQTLAALSRQDLAGMGMTTETSTAAARQQQKDLLAKQIALAEQELSETQKRFQTGVATQADARTAEREVLRLREQLAALEANNAESVGLSAPVTSDEDQEIQHIQQMIQNSPDLINAASDGSTPLVKAAYNGWLKVAAYLLDHGADVNVSCSGIPATWEQVKVQGPFTPLVAAVVAGNKAMAKFLIDRGADINFKSQNGDTPLSLAAGKGFQAVAEVLLASHADVNAQNNGRATPLFSAVEGGQVKIIQMLLAAGANPNAQDWSGRTPLSYAADGDDPQIVKLLLAAKADPNLGSLDAPLLCAIHKNDVATAEELLQAGANPNLKGVENWDAGGGGIRSVTRTPMFLAVSEKQLPFVKLLLEYKADPNDSQSDSRSLLFSALSDINVLATLLDAGASVDARDGTAKTGDNRVLNWTPLLWAVEQGLPAEVVEILLKHGADPNARDGAFGQSALNWTVGWGNERVPNRKVLELLLDYKANPNERYSTGQTLLDKVKNQRPWPADETASLAELADLLRRHGALDNLPDWNRIMLSRPSENYSKPIFFKNTNNWDHFTLLEGIYWNGTTPLDHSSFPDLAHIVIVRPATSGTTAQRIAVNLLNTTNGLDCTHDVPLKFGDAVEIPEREHTLAEPWVYLTGEQTQALLDHFNSLAGEAKLIVAGGQTIQLPLKPFESQIEKVLERSDARAALTSYSDLSRVIVSRRDTETGKTEEWNVDCSGQSETQMTPFRPFALRRPGAPVNPNDEAASDLWLRAGDVIEVPLKP